MSRLKRKFREDVYLKSKGGMLDLMDNALKVEWRLNDGELNYIFSTLEKNYIDLFVKADRTFAESRIIITEVNKLVEEYGKISNR